MYEHLLQLDTLNMTFNRFGAKLIALFLALVMYGVALGMKPHFFKSIFYKPRSLFIGLLCQWLILPLITFIIVVLAKGFITPMVAMGLLLVASCPGGAVSNFMASHAKGNPELSVTMTTITTIAAPIFTPLNFAMGWTIRKIFCCIGKFGIKDSCYSYRTTVYNCYRRNRNTCFIGPAYHKICS